MISQQRLINYAVDFLEGEILRLEKAIASGSTSEDDKKLMEELKRIYKADLERIEGTQ